MQTIPEPPAGDDVKPILDWLAAAHGLTGMEEARGLQQQLLALRDAAVPTAQRLRLLELLYGHAAAITVAQLPALREVSLPVSRRKRLLARLLQDCLEILSQDHLNTLAELFDPQTAGQSPPPLTSLLRAMQCLSWHLLVSHLIAAPAGPGIWQHFHATFRTSRRMGLATAVATEDQPCIQHIYLANLLVAIAQPASFTPSEREFVHQYAETHADAVTLSDDAPAGHDGIFWIDPERDTPAHALMRRSPPPETAVLYLACDRLAERAAEHLAALEKGVPAAELGLPDFAEGHGGRGVLRRLCSCWGRPVRRKFPRRRQSYRAELCAGLDRLWQLCGSTAEAADKSEWMIINESPEGFAMMHVAGSTDQLRVGDIVALRPRREEEQDKADWYICIVRWALSENPEHIEIGLQVVAPRAIPATLALPGEQRRDRRLASALLLPAVQPQRQRQALVVPSGLVTDPSQKLLVLVERDNIAVYEMRATELNEQTSSIEMFTVEPDESP